MDRRLMWIVLCLFVVLPAGSEARRRAQPGVHEFGLGLGWSHSFEDDVFNVESDEELGSAFAYKLSYDYNFTPRFALGPHLYGFSQDIEGFVLESIEGDLIDTTFDFFTAYLGLHGRWTIVRSTLSPYLLGGVNFIWGEARSGPTGSLGHDGWGFVAGAGVHIAFTPLLGVAVEGTFSPSSSAWDAKPFINSTGYELDPTTYAVQAHLTFRWPAW